MKAPIGSEGEITPITATRFFFHIMAGGVRIKLLDSLITLNVLETLNEQGPLLDNEFVDIFHLNELRAKKWLFLLEQDGFLIKNSDNRYDIGPVSKAIFGDNGNRWWYFRQMFYSLNVVMVEPIVGVLQGKPLKTKVTWPPETKAEHHFMEEYNARTAKACFTPLIEQVDFKNVTQVLDVGGGDGTIACTLAQLYENLQIKLYNLPQGAEMAREKIKKWHKTDRIEIIEGDFFIDKKLPKKNDIVLFSRVLCDWGIDKCVHLLTMAYKALNKGGKVVLCEPFRENNEEYVLAWEFRFMFWDDFELNLYKSSSKYKKILTDIGFKNITLSGRNQEGVYRVMTAQKL